MGDKAKNDAMFTWQKHDMLRSRWQLVDAAGKTVGVLEANAWMTRYTFDWPRGSMVFARPNMFASHTHITEAHTDRLLAVLRPSFWNMGASLAAHTDGATYTFDKPGLFASDYEWRDANNKTILAIHPTAGFTAVKGRVWLAKGDIYDVTTALLAAVGWVRVLAHKSASVIAAT